VCVHVCATLAVFVCMYVCLNAYALPPSDAPHVLAFLHLRLLVLNEKGRSVGLHSRKLLELKVDELSHADLAKKHAQLAYLLPRLGS